MLNRQRFLLPTDAVLFDPILTRYALMPNLFSEQDNALHYMYLYKQQSQDGSIFNNVVIAKDSTQVVVEFRGDTANGNITGSTFLRDGNGNYDKMTIQYEPSTSGMLTDFYRLPFDDSLGIDSQTKNNFALYPNPTRDLLNIQSDVAASSIQVYSMTGKMLRSKKLNAQQSSINLSALTPGINIAHISLSDGKSEKVKFIKN